MKFIDKIELIAKASNDTVAVQLQLLLDQILKNPQNSPAI